MLLVVLVVMAVPFGARLGRVSPRWWWLRDGGPAGCGLEGRLRGRAGRYRRAAVGLGRARRLVVAVSRKTADSGGHRSHWRLLDCLTWFRYMSMTSSTWRMKRGPPGSLARCWETGAEMREGTISRGTAPARPAPGRRRG